jgi:transglutaminase-like putative cysteine protease
LPSSLALLIGAAGAAVVALSWRTPVHGLLRLLIVFALLAAVFGMSGHRFGRDTGCAVLAAMLAIKPAETFNLREARSLLGFALFAPFGTFLLDQGPLSLLLGLVGAVLALCALQRLADLESGDLVAVQASRRFAGIGRLLAIGLPLALAAFWLFPRLGSPLWGVPERALARTGLSDQMTPGQWIDLMADDTPALRVRFSGAVPPTSQMYWRGPVLSDFDGRSWTRARWMGTLPAAPVQRAATQWDYEIEIEPTDRRQMVALELPLEAPEGTRLGHDHELFADRPLSALTRWRMQSAPPAAFEPQLRAGLRQAALALPDGYNPRTLALARQWRADAGRDDAAIVQRAMDWIQRDFAYTLSTPLAGHHSADEFLFDQQEGFCEHFSSAFVVLMRGAGIPARVVTGYVGGYRNPLGDYWLVRRSDAHAWAEVWLEGRGWVRADPTAAVAPERIYDTLDDRIPGSGSLFGRVLGDASGLFNMTDWLRRGWNDLVLGFNAERQTRLLRPLGIDRLDGVKLGLLFALMALLGLLWMIWLSRRGERQPDPVLRAWHALERRYRRRGLGRAPDEPATQGAQRVAAGQPGGDDGLDRLSHRFSDWRYATTGPDKTSRGSRERESRELIRALRRHRPHAGRDGAD